jgi:Fic family protein
MLREPILYLSLYLKQNRTVYYDLLQQVRINGAWETWLEFFLQGITKTAQQALHTIIAVNKLFAEDFTKVNALGRARFACLHTLEYLKELPQVSVPLLSQELGMTAPTARSALQKLLQLGIVAEISGKQRDRVYVYQRYLNILEEGTEPLRV